MEYQWTIYGGVVCIVNAVGYKEAYLKSGLKTQSKISDGAFFPS